MTWIVLQKGLNPHSLVQQTLGRYLDERGYNPAHPVRVLHPACGSGSFLIEAFDELDQHLARQRGQEHGTYDICDHARQREILEQCIYGVDKDEQAVEVARLNLLLKVLHIREKLPTLTNIRCGDSLISGEAKELEEYFGAEWKTRNPFDWRAEFDKVMAEGGFDVIVGNPPYVRAENMPRDERNFYMDGKHFEVAYGKFDIHILFLERAIKLLKEGGRLGFIIPYAGLTQNYGMILRKFMLNNCVIETIVDLSKYRVFRDASIATCIVILRKESNAPIRDANAIHVVRQETYDGGIQADTQNTLTIAQVVFSTTPSHAFRLDLDIPTIQLLKKVDAVSIPLGDICYLITGAVLHDSKTGASKERLIHQKHHRGYKPYIEAKEIARYVPPVSIQFLDYRTEGMHRPKFPELFENDKLMICRIASKVIATIDASNIYTDHTIDLAVRKDKLLNVRNRDLAISEEEAKRAENYDLRYLLGMINSRLASFYLQRFLGMAIEINPETARQLPIRCINFADPAEKQQHDEMVARVSEMLELQKEYAAVAREKFADKMDALKRRIDAVDAAIDAIVYRLYDLSEEEIRVVEGKERIE